MGCDTPMDRCLECLHKMRETYRPLAFFGQFRRGRVTLFIQERQVCRSIFLHKSDIIRLVFFPCLFIGLDE